MDSGDVSDVALESCREIVVRAQRKRKTLGEASGRDAFTQQICQLVETKLLSNATCQRWSSVHVVEAVRDRDVLNDVTRVDDIVPCRWNLKSQATKQRLLASCTSPFKPQGILAS